MPVTHQTLNEIEETFGYGWLLFYIKTFVGNSRITTMRTRNYVIIRCRTHVNVSNGRCDGHWNLMLATITRLYRQTIFIGT